MSKSEASDNDGPAATGPQALNDAFWRIAKVVSPCRVSIEPRSEFARLYHLNFLQIVERFPDETEHIQINRGADLHDPELQECFTETVLKLLRRILEIPGVTTIYADTYSVDVVIGHAFEWGPIDPAILHLLAEACDAPLRHMEIVRKEIEAVSDATTDDEND